MYRNIFDTHSHYADSAFDGDRDELLAALPDKGVRFAALAGSSMQDSAENVALAQKYGYIYAAQVGGGAVAYLRNVFQTHF